MINKIFMIKWGKAIAEKLWIRLLTVSQITFNYNFLNLRDFQMAEYEFNVGIDKFKMVDLT